MSRFLAAGCVLLGLGLFAGCGDKPKVPGSCKSEKDCKAGQKCFENKCVLCIEDSHCGQGQRCSAGACVAKPECEKDDECSPGKVCQAGKCKSCAMDSECGPGGSCEAGACKKAQSCTKDDDCADDEDCVSGFCRRAGATSTNVGGCQLSTVFFGYDDSSIQASERDRLDGNAACIEKTPGKQVFLMGHTDTSGTEEYNIALSERRAQSVADYLSRLGSDPARMQVVPKGETEPTGAGDDKDRRVEFGWK